MAWHRFSERMATIDDLARCDGKAEVIAGRIIPIIPTGRRPNLVAGRTCRSHTEFVDTLGLGEFDTDNRGLTVRALTSGHPAVRARRLL